MGYQHIRVNDELGYPICDQDGCDSPVHVTLVWTEPKQYCLPCANQVLGIAEVMGFPTPSATIEQFDLYEFEKWRVENNE